MRHQQILPGQAATEHPTRRVVPLAFGFSGMFAWGLWLLEPALALPAVLAAGLPAILALSFCALRQLGPQLRPRRPPPHQVQWLDPHSGLLAGPALAALGEPLLERCRGRGEPLTLLVFDFDALAERQDGDRAPAQHQTLAVIGRRLRHLADRQGWALRVSPSRFVVLLPGVPEGLAPQLLAPHGWSCRSEASAQERVPVPRLTALAATGQTDSLQQLLHKLQAQPARGPDGSEHRCAAVRPQPARRLRRG